MTCYCEGQNTAWGSGVNALYNGVSFVNAPARSFPGGTSYGENLYTFDVTVTQNSIIKFN